MRHIVAPYSLEAFLDGQPVFQIAFDRLTRDDNNQLGMLYDMAYSTPGAYFINISSQSGFNLEKTGVRLAEKLRQMPPGRTKSGSCVKDQQQNQALALIPLRKVIDEPPPCRRKNTRQGIRATGSCRERIFDLANHDDVVVKVKDFPASGRSAEIKNLPG